MPAGPMRQLLAWERREDVNPDFPEDYGNTQSAFVTQFTMHAGRKALRGSEAVQAARLDGTQPYILTVRQCDQARLIRTDWQARDVRTGRVLQVKSIMDPTDRGAYLDIMVVEGVAG